MSGSESKRKITAKARLAELDAAAAIPDIKAIPARVRDVLFKVLASDTPYNDLLGLYDAASPESKELLTRHALGMLCCLSGDARKVEGARSLLNDLHDTPRLVSGEYAISKFGIRYSDV